MKIKDPDVLTNLLLCAFLAEETEKNIILETLYWMKDKTTWDVLFRLYCDNEIHKKMLVQAVKRLGGRVVELEGRTFDFKGKSKEEMMQSISNWEYFTFNYYSHLLEMFDFEGLEVEGMGTEDAREIKRMIEGLAEWETKHIEMLKKFFKGSLLFKFVEK